MWKNRQNNFKSQMTPRKQHFPDTIGLMYIMNSETVTSHTRPTHIQARQNPSIGEEKIDTKSHPYITSNLQFIPVRKEKMSFLQ